MSVDDVSNDQDIEYSQSVDGGLSYISPEQIDMIKDMKRTEQIERILTMKKEMEESLMLETQKLQELEIEVEQGDKFLEETVRKEQQTERERLKEVKRKHLRSQSCLPVLPDSQINQILSREFVTIARTGQIFRKHQYTTTGLRALSKPRDRFVKISANKNGIPKSLSWGKGPDREINFTDVLYIMDGHSTKAFAKCRADPARCFSVVTHDRTLDLEAIDEETCALWVKGLRSVLDYITEYWEEAAKGIGNRRLFKQERAKRMSLSDVSRPLDRSSLKKMDTWKARLIEGSKVDCLNKNDVWCVGTVRYSQVNEGKVYVHFDGTPITSDIWFQLNSPRLLPFGSTEASTLVNQVKKRNLSGIKALTELIPPPSPIVMLSDNSNVIREAKYIGGKTFNLIVNHVHNYIDYEFRVRRFYLTPEIIHIIAMNIIQMLVED